MIFKLFSDHFTIRDDFFRNWVGFFLGFFLIFEGKFAPTFFETSLHQMDSQKFGPPVEFFVKEQPGLRKQTKLPHPTGWVFRPRKNIFGKQNRTGFFSTNSGPGIFHP